VRPLLEPVRDWEAFIGEADDEKFNELLRGHASTGRSLGPDSFVEPVERLLARSLKRKKPGPKSRERDIYTGNLFSDREQN
jgi:putative transposase